MYGFIIPKKGWDLLAKAVATKKLNISRVMVGGGRLTENENPTLLVDLVVPVAAGTSTIPQTKDNVVSFVVEYRSDLNGGLDNGFWLNEFGVFAIDPDIGEILLYYGTLGDYPQYVAPYTGGSIDIRRFPVSIILTDDINVTISYPPIAFMTAEDVAEYCVATCLPMAMEMFDGLIRIHNADLAAHPDIRALIYELLARIGRLEDMTINEVMSNPFLITFDTLDDVYVTGVWNQALQRMEF